MGASSRHLGEKTRLQMTGLCIPGVREAIVLQENKHWGRGP